MSPDTRTDPDRPAGPDITGPDATGPDATGLDATGPGATGPGTAATPGPAGRNVPWRPGRRAVLAGAGVVAVGAVAACGSGDEQDSAEDTPAGAPGTVLGPASQIPVGGGMVFADQQIVVTQPTQGRYQGLSSTCPHAGCQVNAVRDGAVICPCHGSRFGLDGAVVQGPAQSPLTRRAVALKGTDITLA